MPRRAVPWEVVVGLLILVVLAAAIAPHGLEISNSLAWGWLEFLERVLPRVSVRCDGVLFFLVGLAIALVCAHSFLRWLVRNWSESSLGSTTPWRFGSTAAVVALLLMMFVVGISLSGIVHQVGWLMHSPVPLETSKIQSLEDNARSTYRMGEVASVANRSWIEGILPYLPHITPETDRALPWNDPRNAEGYKNIVPGMLNPSGSLPLKSPDGFGLSHFAGNVRLFQGGQAIRATDIEQSSTLMIGEVNAGLVPWAQPDNVRDPARGLRAKWDSGSGRELGFGSPAGQFGQTMFVKVDGSVQAIDNKIDPEVLRQLSELHPRVEP